MADPPGSRAQHNYRLIVCDAGREKRFFGGLRGAEDNVLGSCLILLVHPDRSTRTTGGHNAAMCEGFDYLSICGHAALTSERIDRRAVLLRHCENISVRIGGTVVSLTYATRSLHYAHCL